MNWKCIFDMQSGDLKITKTSEKQLRKFVVFDQDALRELVDWNLSKIIRELTLYCNCCFVIINIINCQQLLLTFIKRGRRKAVKKVY